MYRISATAVFLQLGFMLRGEGVCPWFIPIGALAFWAADRCMGDTGYPFFMTAVTLPFLDNDLYHGVRIIAYHYGRGQEESQRGLDNMLGIGV
jgi:hypothetical protein